MPPNRDGHFTPTPEGLDVLSVKQNAFAASLHMEEVFSGEVAIHSRFSFNGPRELPIDRDHSPVVFLGLHFNREAWTGYTAGVFSDGQFWYVGIQKWNCCCRDSVCVEKHRRPLDFDPTEHVLEIELLATDSDVEFRVWPADDRRPSTPQVSIADTTYRAGLACFFYADKGENLPGRFYSFCVETPGH